MDLKLIKAEIEALYNKNYGTDEQSHVAVINDVVAILDSHINPKPEPTSAGIWKCVKDGNNHYVTVAEDLSYPKYCAGGQWEKEKDI